MSNLNNFVKEESNTDDMQSDKLERAITSAPIMLRFYAGDDKVNLPTSPDEFGITCRGSDRICVFCMYGIPFDKRNYCKANNTYSWVLPWSYIKGIWSDENDELIVIKSTEAFKEALERAAANRDYQFKFREVAYDLDEKLPGHNFFDEVSNNSLEVAFHKQKRFEVQHEVRFAVLTKEKKDHVILELDKEDLRFSVFQVPKGNDLIIQIHGCEFDETGGILRFSEDINVSMTNEGLSENLC